MCQRDGDSQRDGRSERDRDARSRAGLAPTGDLRRAVLKVLAALPFSGLGAAVAWARRTPAATEGPFYPTPRMRFADADNDLVRIAGREAAALGDVVVVKGRVLDGEGQPVAGARVEIWQCDANGRYLHSADRGGRRRDAGFQGFGHVITGQDGSWAFRTIKPVAYPGRTPHIHMKVLHGGRELTTQLYIDGHPLNARDFLYRQLSAAEQKAVAMRFGPGADGEETTVDIVV